MYPGFSRKKVGGQPIGPPARVWSTDSASETSGDESTSGEEQEQQEQQEERRGQKRPAPAASAAGVGGKRPRTAVNQDLARAARLATDIRKSTGQWVLQKTGKLEPRIGAADLHADGIDASVSIAKFRWHKIHPAPLRETHRIRLPTSTSTAAAATAGTPTDDDQTLVVRNFKEAYLAVAKLGACGGDVTRAAAKAGEIVAGIYDDTFANTHRCAGAELTQRAVFPLFTRAPKQKSFWGARLDGIYPQFRRALEAQGLWAPDTGSGQGPHAIQLSLDGVDGQLVFELEAVPPGHAPVVVKPLTFTPAAAADGGKSPPPLEFVLQPTPRVRDMFTEETADNVRRALDYLDAVLGTVARVA